MLQHNDSPGDNQWIDRGVGMVRVYKPMPGRIYMKNNTHEVVCEINISDAGGLQRHATNEKAWVLTATPARAGEPETYLFMLESAEAAEMFAEAFEAAGGSRASS